MIKKSMNDVGNKKKLIKEAAVEVKRKSNITYVL